MKYIILFPVAVASKSFRLPQHQCHVFALQKLRQRDSISTIHAFGSDKTKKEARKFDVVFDSDLKYPQIS
jgi:hypothetical protein